jgi:two-component system response regulator LytT
MKVLVVEGENALFSSAHWLQQHGIPDIFLVSEEVVKAQQLINLTESKVNATVVFTVQSDQFTYYAFRISHLEHLFPELSTGRHPEEAFAPVLTAPAVVSPAPPMIKKTTAHRTRFLVRQGQKFASIETEVIAYFFSEGRFIFFKTFDGQKYLVEYTLEDLETMIDPQAFFRINRSLLIAFKSVEQIHPYFGNRLKLFLDPAMDKDIIVSREKVNDFKTWLGQ